MGVTVTPRTEAEIRRLVESGRYADADAVVLTALEALMDREEVRQTKLRELVVADAGFIFAGWCGSEKCEAKVKEETKATIRCLPFEEFRSQKAPSNCLVCGGSAQHEAVWSRAY